MTQTTPNPLHQQDPYSTNGNRPTAKVSEYSPSEEVTPPPNKTKKSQKSPR